MNKTWKSGLIFIFISTSSILISKLVENDLMIILLFLVMYLVSHFLMYRFILKSDSIHSQGIDVEGQIVANTRCSESELRTASVTPGTSKKVKIEELDKLTQSGAIKVLKEMNLWDECSIRMDGRIEWICEHGVGHTIWSPKEQGDSGYVHGCDWCCRKFWQ